MSLSIIVAATEDWVIGDNNRLPWEIPEDLKHFKKTTKNHAIIMGRKTYESIGRPLPKRFNIIVTRQEDYDAPGCFIVNSLDKAIDVAQQLDPNPFIIGGSEIYRQSLSLVNTIYLTKIHVDFSGDSYFPKLDEDQWLTEILKAIDGATFLKLTRRQSIAP